MPVTAKWAYFDHAAVAPITQDAADAMTVWMQQAAGEGDVPWLSWAKQVEQTRHAAAQLIGAEVDEIALTPNTTAGINFVAEGLDWQPGDNVVTLSDEFPSNLYPWMHLADRGVETRLVPTDHGRVDLDQFAECVDERTRVVAVSWVGYATGCRRDLAALGQLAKSRDALFLVDAIQGLGAFPISVSENRLIDVLCADGHKWLLSPEGAGIAFIRRECLSRLRPTSVGWNSVVQGGDFSRIELNLKPTAARYEGGSLNMAGFIGLGASLRLLDSLGPKNLAAAIVQFTDQACTALTAIGANVVSPRNDENEKSGIVAFDLPGQDPQAVRRRCLERGVALACRGGRLRISPHAYNDDADLQRLIAALSQIVSPSS